MPNQDARGHVEMFNSFNSLVEDAQHANFVRARETYKERDFYHKSEAKLRMHLTFPEVLSTYPYLGADGFDPFDGRYGKYSSGKTVFEQSRQILVNDEAVIVRAIGIFSRLPVVRRLNYLRTSYSFKHLTEDILGRYISHGSCLVAAFMSGIPVKRCEKGHVGAYLGINEDVVELLEKHLLTHSGRGSAFFTDAFIAKLHKLQAEGRLRRSISNTLRFQILKRDNYRCCLCGIRAKDSECVRLEVDHIIPRANGGTNATDNLWTLCHECNHGKGTHNL